MPGAAIKAFFLDNEDWSPTGLTLVVSHELEVRKGIIIEIREGIDITLGDGSNTVEG